MSAGEAAVTVDALAAALGVGPVAGGDVGVSGLTHDSRQVRPGVAFACVPGARSDGHDFAVAAIAAGAPALLCERRMGTSVPELVVPSVRAVLGIAAATVHGHPARSLHTVGVTGTNGKTTVVTLLQAILSTHGWPTISIGTLTGARTTPEATDLQAALADAVAEGVQAVAMEVSSHALSFGRVGGMRFDVAAFTMLGRDHLEFHGDVGSYFDAKASLFTAEQAAVAVVNVDDPWGRRLVERIDAIPVIEVSLDDVADRRVALTGSDFTWRGHEAHLSLIGEHNLSNALVAATAASALGASDDAVVGGLAAVPSIPGRLEPVGDGNPFSVLIDYAHTPDALRRVVGGLRQLTEGRLIVVFGAGGDRDRGKRPEMGAAVADADLVVVTSDNPRSEDPAAIAAEIVGGLPAAMPRAVVLDREEAIRRALSDAGAGDCVVVAGKGHETTQIIGSVSRPFDDREVAARLLRERGA